MTTNNQSANMGRTTVSLDDETADVLHEMKERGDSYDDVVRRLIEDCTDRVNDPRDTEDSDE
jgi:predicted CopG family antitoxin